MIRPTAPATFWHRSTSALRTYLCYKPLQRLALPLLALLIGLALVWSNGWGWRQELNWRTTDLLVRLQTTGQPDPRIAIVGIDDAALSDNEGYGRRLTDWDRTRYAELLERLSAAGARVVVFDIIFSGTDHQGDAAFAQALAANPSVVLAVTQRADASAIEQPTPRIAQALRYAGHTTVRLDDDGVVRRMPLRIGDTDNDYDALALQAVRRYWRLPADSALSINKQRATLPNGFSIPVGTTGDVLIDFRGATATYPVYGFREVVAGTVPDDAFRDRIVFVGVTATASGDQYLTPTQVGMPGVEIHAHMAATLLRQSALSEQPLATTNACVLGIALLLGMLATTRRPLVLLGTLAVGIACVALAGLVALVGFNTRPNIAEPLLTLAVVGASLLALQAAEQRQAHMRVLALFEHQTSPSVLKELLHAADTGTLHLGGERRDMTVLFADMRGFTALADCLHPEQMMDVTNIYLDLVTHALIAHGGTLVQYSGDQALAVFNAPLDQPDHARRAVAAAMAVQAAIVRFNHSPAAVGLPATAMFGIGINTGVGVAGNVGSSLRYNYSIIGDVANTAARLCGIAPPGSIYIGPDTVVEDLGDLRKQIDVAGEYRLKGKATPVVVHRIDCYTSAV